MQDNSSSNYESAVFQFKVPLTNSFDDKALELVQTGLDWDQYDGSGGQLSYNDYIKAILFNKTGFVTTDPTDKFNVTVGQVTKYFSQVEIKLIFSVPGMEPIGEHRVWTRWAFYNPYNGPGSCNEEISCLGKNTIDGPDEPYFWTIFMNLTDYFDTDDRSWIMNLYWVMAACSLFGLFGLPLQFIIRLYLQFFILEKSIKEYDEYTSFYLPTSSGANSGTSQ